MEEINEKILAKEATFERYQGGVQQYDQNRLFQNHERKFYHQVGEEWTEKKQQPTATETNNFEVKYANRKNITEIVDANITWTMLFKKSRKTPSEQTWNHKEQPS